MSEEFRPRLEAVNLEDNLKRVDFLLGNAKNVTSHGMGIKLALLMAQEMREGEPLGTKSGPVIAEWSEIYSDAMVEQAVSGARAFLLNPETLVETIGSKIFDEDV